MKREKLTLIPIIVFFGILLSFLYLLIIDRDKSNIPSALLEKKVPKFETNSLINSSKFFSDKEISNQVTIVNFFATWCKPCRDEHKFIMMLSKKENLKLIGINYKDNSKKTKKWLKNLGNPYDNIAIDKNGRIAIDWGVYGIPETFIINSNGVIKYRHVGPITNKIYKKINLIIKQNE